MAAKAASKDSITATSAPKSASSSRRLSSGMIMGGARWGAKKWAGWGSKVSTTASPPEPRARAAAAITSAWCPRCTPSKFPMATVGARRGRPSSAAIRWRPRTTFIASAYLPGARVVNPPGRLPEGRYWTGHGFRAVISPMRVREWPALEPLLFGGALALYAAGLPLGLDRASSAPAVAGGATLEGGGAPLGLLAARLLGYLPVG